VILCAGKVYYDLLKFRDENKITSTAIIRIEHLYPLDEAQLKAAVGIPEWETIVWCQEESQNMGAWNFIAWQLRRLLETSVLVRGPRRQRQPGGRFARRASQGTATHYPGRLHLG